MIKITKKNGEKVKPQNIEGRRIYKSNLGEFIRKADVLAERMVSQTIDSTDLIREDRENL